MSTSPTRPVQTDTPTHTLPASAYTDPQLYRDELRDIFEHGWTLMGHASEVAETGQYLTARIGREPVMVIRGGDGELRALSNVCRHRAAVMLDGTGTCGKVIRCPYHAWTYRLDGSLAAAPSARGFRSFDRESVALPGFGVAELAGLVFATPNPDPPDLVEILGPAGPFLESLGLGRLAVHRWPQEGRHRGIGLRGREPAVKGRFVEDFTENWKVMADNYLEDYHVPVAHPSLVRLLDVKETVGDSNEWSEWSRVPMRDRPSRIRSERLYQRLARPMPGMPESFERSWGNVHIWPATFMEIYPHHIDTWQLEPHGLASTRATTMSLVHPDAGPQDRGARWLIHQLMGDVMAEDVDITSRVQTGVAAPSYSEGILNDEQESSVVRFQKSLRRELPRIDVLAGGERS